MLEQQTAPFSSATEASRQFPDALPSSLHGSALFLDVDGTLLDIAPTPDAIVVPDALAYLLHGLSRATGGALALVTGRSIGYLDTILRTEGICVAGLHGAERRDADGSHDGPSTDPQLDMAKARLAAFAAAHPGVLFEDKGAA
ncbi:MAG: trehalose-phosphatase, partial [Mesorhizobium sp.]|nr:trehalose-phosphatase [Mesorhizobium sp.]